jgi:hypothetical protein
MRLVASGSSLKLSHAEERLREVDGGSPRGILEDRHAHGAKRRIRASRAGDHGRDSEERGRQQAGCPSSSPPASSKATPGLTPRCQRLKLS